jgi:hypothetical protein
MKLNQYFDGGIKLDNSIKFAQDSNTIDDLLKLIQTTLVVSMVIGEQVKKENFLQALHLNFLNKNKNSFTQN